MHNENQVISLFSGAGGLSLGFKQAGIQPIFAVDVDLDACASYSNNLGVEALNDDLSTPNEKLIKTIAEYRQPFALIGGPPCQGFSSAGRKDGTDPRNGLIFRYLSIVQMLSPRWFLFENVEGLLTSKDGTSIRDLVREFIDLGYRVRLEKVNFASYGLPQARKRVLLIGNRLGLDFRFPLPTHSFNAGKHKRAYPLPLAPSLCEALTGLGQPVAAWEKTAPYETSDPSSPYDRLMREGNVRDSVSAHVVSTPVDIAELLCLLKPGQTMKDLPTASWHKSFERRAFRRVKDGTPTEKRGGAPSGIKRLVGELNSLTITSAATREFIHPSEHRTLTPRECARLQSFPDVFAFSGTPSSVIQQIGNAFPPLAARIFAEHLITLDGLFGSDYRVPVSPNASGLLAYKLTDAQGMSPALAKTELMLRELQQAELELKDSTVQVA
jgi:DNA (cytosine-5)-methyltransferase 1